MVGIAQFMFLGSDQLHARRIPAPRFQQYMPTLNLRKKPAPATPSDAHGFEIHGPLGFCVTIAWDTRPLFLMVYLDQRVIFAREVNKCVVLTFQESLRDEVTSNFVTNKENF